MTNDPFYSPSDGGESLTDHAGSLLLITPTEYVEEIQTKFGTKDAVRVDFVVLDETESGDVEEYEDSLIFSGVLIGQTKGKVGKGMVLGRLGQRPPTQKGYSPAWTLEDPTDEDKDAARAYLAEVDPFN